MGNPVALYGAGGHAKVVLDALEQAGARVVGVIDDDSMRHGDEWCGYPVSPFAALEEFGLETKVVVAVGDRADRERLTARVLEAGYRLGNAVHPTAAIARDVFLGAGVAIMAQVAVNPGSRIGDGVIVNTGATVDHDCTIGEFTHIAPGARLAGGIEVGARVLIGIGVTILPGVKVGADATIGAGSVVLQNVEPGDTVVGTPAISVTQTLA